MDAVVTQRSCCLVSSFGSVKGFSCSLSTAWFLWVNQESIFPSYWIATSDASVYMCHCLGAVEHVPREPVGRAVLRHPVGL